MKLVRVGIALLMLAMPAACSSQQAKPVGYDVGSCSPTEYFAVHFDIVGQDLKLTLMNDEPGVVNKPDPILYKFQRQEKDAKIYLSEGGVELTLKTDKHMIIGVAKIDGKVTSIVFGVEGDGSKLAANGNGMLQVCQRLRAESGSDDPVGPTSQI